MVRRYFVIAHREVSGYYVCFCPVPSACHSGYGDVRGVLGEGDGTCCGVRGLCRYCQSSCQVTMGFLYGILKFKWACTFSKVSSFFKVYSYLWDTWYTQERKLRKGGVRPALTLRNG